MLQIYCRYIESDIQKDKYKKVKKLRRKEVTYAEVRDMAMNAAQVYQGNKINTASPAELTLMLYEGAIKFCNLALIGMEEGDVMKTHTNIMKAERIVEEFRATLNHKYPVAEEFERVYLVIYDKLVMANIKKDPEALNEALKHLRDMRDIWKQVMKTAKTA